MRRVTRLRESAASSEICMKLIHSITSSAWAVGFTVVRCSGKGCDRWLTLRQISARKRGIGLGSSWYCSSGCFSFAATEQISNLLMAESVSGNHLSRMPLGLILVDSGHLTHEQFRIAVEEQKNEGGEIGEVLIRHSFATEKQVTSARAAQWGCPIFAAPKRLAKMLVQIPSILFKTYAMVPLHYGTATNRLLIGFVHGIDYGALYTIEQMTGCKTQPCFVTPGDYQTQIQQERAETGEPGILKALIVDVAKSPAEMAESIYSCCIEIGAIEVLFARCKDHLWARLKAGPKTTDILFKVS
jgi:hypothetical protein